MRKIGVSIFVATAVTSLSLTAAATGGLRIIGSLRADVLFGSDQSDQIFGLTGSDRIVAKGGDDRVSGGFGKDRIDGGPGADDLHGNFGRDELSGGPGADTLSGGRGADAFVFEGDAFDGVDVSASGRQIVGNEDFITDYKIGRDRFVLSAKDFGVAAPVVFASVDANAPGAAVAPKTNVVVLVNADNDNDPTTPFLAGTAANQIAQLVSDPGPGFFIYFNSNLGLNRLVYSTDLSDATADLKILNRLTNVVDQDAIDALADFTAADFEIR